MGEKVEINLYTECIIDNNLFISLLNSIGYSVTNIACIDNWQWDNLNIIDKKVISSCLGEDKIIIIDLEDKEHNMAGAQIYKEGGFYLYDFWCDAKCTQLKNDYFISIEEKIEEYLATFQLNYAAVAIGSEIFIPSNTTLTEAIKGSHNVYYWIINQNYCINLPVSFSSSCQISNGNAQIIKRMNEE